MATGTKIDPKFVKSRLNEVKGMAAYGLTDDEIASIVDISESSVRKHFRKQLTDGRANMRAAIRKAQYEKAVKEKDTKMLIWLGKMYLKQSEPKATVELQGAVKYEAIYYGEVAAKKAKERSSNT